jgi:hypothetical protein
MKGKLGKRVHLRQRSSKRPYSRLWFRGPLRRTRAQERSMLAMASGTKAWWRLSQAERDLWNTDPPVKTMAMKNRGAHYWEACGWNWFIGWYIVNARTMIFAEAKLDGPVTIVSGQERTPLRLFLPGDHPTNLQIRAKANLIGPQSGPSATATVTIAGRTTLGAELFDDSDSTPLAPGDVRGWATGFKYGSSGQAQVIEMLLDAAGNSLEVKDLSLEVIY